MVINTDLIEKVLNRAFMAIEGVDRYPQGRSEAGL